MEVKVGNTIYVPTSLYLSHGADDFRGGKATVTKVYQNMSDGEITTFVRIAELPRTGFNWGQVLSKEQEQLAKRFGNKRAHADPDYRDEFNKGD